MPLLRYHKKRNFSATPEPKGAMPSRSADAPFFVVQKHDASRLHYDFRLAMEGVLKSWAVPRGFPTAKGDKRLAVEVEDHPIEYATFEGTIAPGNYGAGTVMLWDRGAYEVSGGDPVAALRAGKLHLTLSGSKLKGEWTLIRLRSENGKQNWLILKSSESADPISAAADDTSVKTRRSMDQIARGRSAQWQSNRQTSRSDPKPVAATPPKFVEPMKALLVQSLPASAGWIYEIKFDGIRALAIRSRQGVSLLSRNQKPLTDKYHALIEPLQNLPAREFIIDGEIVAVDAHGLPQFQLLQSYLSSRIHKPPLLYYAFDLLQLDGSDLKNLPLSQRKEMLKKLLAASAGPLRFSASIQGTSSRLLAKMKKQGLEGIIAKRASSAYLPGARSGDWLKFKWSNQQEFVIGGFTPPKSSRPFFGALLVGYYQKDKLIFTSKVGTGFSHASLEALYRQLKSLSTAECPFANLSRRILASAQFKGCTWVQPRLVCQIRFAEWTRDGQLRQPVYLGLRPDKSPAEVAREIPASNRTVN